MIEAEDLPPAPVERSHEERSEWKTGAVQERIQVYRCAKCRRPIHVEGDLRFHWDPQIDQVSAPWFHFAEEGGLGDEIS